MILTGSIFVEIRADARPFVAAIRHVRRSLLVLQAILIFKKFTCSIRSFLSWILRSIKRLRGGRS